MSKGFPIGFEMAEKNVSRQTDIHFRIYISRDNTALVDDVIPVKGYL